jgi:hypothetical protein
VGIIAKAITIGIQEFLMVIGECLSVISTTEWLRPLLNPNSFHVTA